MKKLFPFTRQLENEEVVLRLLQDKDLQDLTEIAFDDGIWDYFNEKVQTPLELRNWIQGAIFDFMNKARVPFAIYSKAHGKVIGTTSIFNIADRDDKVEVGYSWIGKGYQGQGFNESAKTLLLNMLFEDYDVARVSFFCDEENIASSKALLKIGAHKEGILRNFKKLNNQYFDVAIYSIVKEDRGSKHKNS